MSTDEPRRRTVVFVATDLSTAGGVNRVIRDASQLLAEQLGAGVSVVSARSSAPPTYAFPASVPIEFHAKRGIASYVRVLRRIRRSRPDYVVGSWTQDNILLAAIFAGSGTRAILVEHQSWFFQGRPVRLLRRQFYRLAWRVLVLNPRELGHYRRFLSNVRLLPNPVALPAELQDVREKLIIAIGHLEPRKNFADAIRGFAQSGLEAEGWSLSIIGQGPELARLQALIAELGLRRVVIHEPVADLEAWYARAATILVTSRIEVFSLVLAEAMGAGVVPVAYGADGPCFILDEFPEHLVPVGDIGGLAAGLRRFADPPADLRAALRESIERRFAPPVVAKQWAELLS